MKIGLELQDDLIDFITDKLVEKLMPLLSANGNESSRDRMLNVKQLADYIGLSRQWIYNNKKKIPHICRNRKPLFRKSEIDRWFETFKKEPCSSSFRNSTATRKSEDIAIQERAFKPQKSNATTSH